MFDIIKHWPNNVQGDRADTNDDANDIVNGFLGMHRPSMHTYVLITNMGTGRVTKVWRTMDGGRKVVVQVEGS